MFMLTGQYRLSGHVVKYNILFKRIYLSLTVVNII